MRYIVAAPHEYLAITGAGVKSVKITKSALVYPLQRCQKFSIQPKDYSLSLQAMSKEKLQFLLPVVFTVGPDVNQRGVKAGQAPLDAESLEDVPEDGGDALMKYAMLLAEGREQKDGGDGIKHIKNLVLGVIEGETRVLVSSLSMEEIFTNREQFKSKISKNIQTELYQFGLRIYNANVKELGDAPNTSYFESLSRKAHEGAINQARIDVAEAQRKGTVGEAQRRGEQMREIAKIDAETAVAKTERDSERAEAEATLATRKTAYNRDVSIAQIEATRATEVRDEELRKTVETKRAHTELERLRASDVVKATILREAQQQAADAKNYAEQAKANATAFAEQKAADAYAYKLNIEADARYNAAAKEADADLLRQQKAAAGMTAMAGAYSEMSKALGGPAGLIQYLMIEKGVYTDLAKANADAVRGLNPKMTIWNTGAQAGGSSPGAVQEGNGQGGIDSIRNMYQMLPPLMSTIHDQTGMTLPEWRFGRLATDMNENEVQAKGKMTNGHTNGDHAYSPNDDGSGMDV